MTKFVKFKENDYLVYFDKWVWQKSKNAFYYQCLISLKLGIAQKWIEN